MKFSYARGVMLALGLSCGTAGSLLAQDGGYGAPSLLPLPTTRQDYNVQPVAAFRRFQAEEAGPTVGSPHGETVITHGGEPAAPLPAPAHAEPVSPYEAAMGGAWGDNGYAGCSDGSCAAEDACGCCTPCTTWWTSGGFLWMGRSREDMRQLSFNTLNPLGAELTTDSANMNFSPGVQVSIGRWFCGGDFGVEATYWGVFPNEQEQTVYGGVPSNLNSALDFGTLGGNLTGGSLSDLYDNAQAHRVQRSWQFHNVELNMLQGSAYSWDAYNGCLSVGLIGGVRYFRFDEDFQYATAQNSPVFGVDPASEAYYDIDVENHLVGGQIGARGNLLLGQRTRLYATPKFGVFNNHITQIQRIYNANGVATINAGNPLAGTPYDINNSKDEIAFLAELDFGLDYRLSHHWSLNVGYRVVAITNVAMATTQIPPAFPDLPGVADIKNDESLFLHGGYVGATFAW